MLEWTMRRGQIKHLLYEHCLNGRIDKQLLIEQFNDLNNVEPIVRCKDCAYGVKTNDEDIFYCTQHGDTPYGTFYCADGERKDEVEE